MLSVGRLILQPVRELSLGERMKLELVAALVYEPEVLVLDTPMIGLDVMAQHTIHEFLRDVPPRRPDLAASGKPALRGIDTTGRRAPVESVPEKLADPAALPRRIGEHVFIGDVEHLPRRSRSCG